MNQDRQYLLALDFGTGAGRCFIVSLDGKECFDGYQEWSYQYPEEAQPGGSEFDPGEFWGIFSRLIRTTLESSGVAPDQIAAVSSTSQREGVVFLDADGRELYAGPNLDMRAPSDLEDFQEQFAERLHQNAGHWPFPMFLPYRLLWFQEHRPEVYRRIDSVLLLNNWLLYRLCGEKAAEPSNGVETLLVSLESREWNPGLIEALDFPRGIFPPVHESGTVIGEVSMQASDETGLRVGTPVVLGGADTQCALLGTAALRPGDAGVPLGTYGPVQLVVDRPIIAAPELIWSGCHTVPEYWVIESTTMEVGQTFRYIRDSFYGSTSLDTYELMNREAEASPAGARGVKAYLGPRMANYKHLKFDIPGGFVVPLPPAPGSASRGDFTRAALEAVAYGVQLNVERLQRVSGQEVSVLRVSGGLSQSALLMQVMADLIGVPITVPVNKEGSALGAAVCAGVGAGIYESMEEGARRLVHWDQQFEPSPERGARYRAFFEDWKADYPKMYGAETLLE